MTACLSSGPAAELIDGNSLMVVVDTNRPDFVDAPELLSRFRKVAVIDHHRRAADYIENCAVNMHEPSASSASELVSELLQYMVPNQTISRVEAESLLAGIYLDTKGFSIKAGVRTFEAAAYLRRAGADMIAVKRLFQNSFQDYMQRERVISCAENAPGGIVVAVADFPVTRPTAAQAADELLNIIGVRASIVAFPIGEDHCRVCALDGRGQCSGAHRDAWRRRQPDGSRCTAAEYRLAQGKRTDHEGD